MNEDKVIEEIIHKSEEKKNGYYIVAIDGRCAAGKTTFSKRFSDATDCSVFHMDDYFLRPEQRTKERLETPGGNVDRERFEQEVLLPLKNGCDRIGYRRYDCREQKLSEPDFITPNHLIIIEGSYSCHPSLYDSYDETIFLDIYPEEQEKRLLTRNAKDFRSFKERWIPMEEEYFETFRIKEICDYCLYC